MHRAMVRQSRKHESVALVAALIAVGGIACGGTSSGPVPDTFAAIVHGVVTGSTGQPVSGARIESELYRGACSTGTRSGGGSPKAVVTDAAGRYAQQFISGDSSSAQCLQVLVRQADGTTRVGAELPSVRLKPRSNASLPYDSLRADISIP